MRVNEQPLDSGLSPQSSGMRVLLAEDDFIARRVLEARLTALGYEVVTASDGTEAWKILQGPEPPSLALLDWMMPGLDGVALCRLIRERAAEPYIYTILVTGKTRMEDLVEGLAAGADDYLRKPVDNDELGVRLQVGRRILLLQAQLIAARERLREQATHDPLTGLWNHSTILEALAAEFSRASREGAAVSALMVDLDHFKRVNDTYGHAAGDQVLKEAAGRLRTAVRQYDLVGRVGGEEFLIVLPHCAAQGAVVIGERIRACIGETPIETVKGSLLITGSIGAATWTPGDPVAPAALLQTADKALYRAKHGGRNRVEFGAPDETVAGCEGAGASG